MKHRVWLPCKREKRGSVSSLHRRHERACGLFGIGGSNYVNVWHQADGTHGLYRFMSGTIFTDADRVMSENVSIGKLRQRGQPNGSAAIIGKNHKGCARCAE